MRYRRLLGVIVGASLAAVAALALSAFTRHDNTATLQVRVAQFGGPAAPGGGSVLWNSPAKGVNVTVVDAKGHAYRANTDSTGTATLQLAPGTYSVGSTYCESPGGPSHLTLTAHENAHAQIKCQVS